MAKRQDGSPSGHVAVALGLGLVLALGVLVALPAARTRAADVVVVNVADFAYQPVTITIRVGDTVQWNNLDGVDHTATSVDGAPVTFDIYLAVGESGSTTFDMPGTYDYYCIPHPFMTGRIIVEPAAEPSSSAPEGGGGQVPDVAMASSPAPPWAMLGGLALLALAVGTAAARLRRAREIADKG